MRRLHISHVVHVVQSSGGKERGGQGSDGCGGPGWSAAMGSQG